MSKAQDKTFPSHIRAHAISAYLIYSNGSQHEYLLLRRCGSYLKGTWQMVTGGVEEGETAFDAALREIFEETGLEPSHLYSADSAETFYLHSKDIITFVPAFVGFLSQKQPIRLSEYEHDDCVWLPFEQARDRLVFSEQKRIISHIHQNFVLIPPNPIFLIKKTEKEAFCER